MEFQELDEGLCFKLTNLEQVPVERRALYSKCVFKKIEVCLASDTIARKVNALRCIQWSGPQAEVWVEALWIVEEVDCINHCANPNIP